MTHIHKGVATARNPGGLLRDSCRKNKNEKSGKSSYESADRVATFGSKLGNVSLKRCVRHNCRSAGFQWCLLELTAPSGPRDGPPAFKRKTTMPRAKKVPVAETNVSARREQLRAEHADAVREKIQTTALTNVLQDYALGKSKVKMTSTRLKAIEMLLDKTLPNLASVKHEIDRQGGFLHQHPTPEAAGDTCGLMPHE